jgi:hypothetical protein
MKSAATLLFLMAAAAGAQDISTGGFADLRGTWNSEQTAAVQGGLGKFRYGGDDAALRLADANLFGTAQLTEDLMVYTDLNYDPRQHTAVDVQESYIRYRPLSLSPWRWSVKAGAFFPPVSMENTGPGWTSLWTLTPSAINSWVGEELRTIGGEGKLEWRGEGLQVEALFAVYGYNDPAGVLLADRGWVLTDRVTGLFDRLRLPDAAGNALHRPPIWREPFYEIDGNPGVYGGVNWRSEPWGRISLLWYDNRADPHAFSHEFAWHTGFLTLGGETEIAGVTLIAQAMSGKTAVNPTGDEAYATHFNSAFLLAGYRFGDWRLAARAELFDTEALDHDPGSRLSEHASAGTLALSWKPLSFLRLTMEGMVADSWRTQRLNIQESPRQIDRQLQLNARFSY